MSQILTSAPNQHAKPPNPEKYETLQRQGVRKAKPVIQMNPGALFHIANANVYNERECAGIRNACHFAPDFCHRLFPVLATPLSFRKKHHEPT